MATVIGFVSEKGGVGKTTAVYHVAVALRRFHHATVLILDTDYQRGGITCRLLPELLENFRIGDVDGTTLHSVYRALYTDSQEIPPLSIRSTNEDIDLIPAHPRLNAVSVDKMPAPANLRDGNKMLLRHLLLIREALSPIAEKYDFALIDSHPDLHDLEKSVIAASDYIVSPVKLDQQSSVAVASTVQAVNDVNEDIDAASQLVGLESAHVKTMFLGAVGMMCREYGGSLKYSEETIRIRLSRTTGILDSYITEGDGLRRAAEASCSVYDITTQNALKQAKQLRELTKEIVNLTQER